MTKLYFTMIAASLSSIAPCGAAYASAAAAGFGAAECSTVERKTDNNPELAMAAYSWAQGYMSALNLRYLRTHTSVDIMPEDFAINAQIGFLKDFCQQHPSKAYDQGVWALFSKLASRQGVAASLP